MQVYRESQRFRQWWLWVLLLITPGVFLYGVFVQLVLQQPFGDRPIGNFSLISLTVFTVLIPVLFYTIRLETTIDEEGVRIRFFPFISKRLYSWNELRCVYVRTYSPLAEYGGWGLRGFGNNRAFNVSGDKGLQLILNNGKKILIGTLCSDELTEYLKREDRWIDPS